MADFDLFSDTWMATDALGRMLPGWKECGSPKANRFVGIFYFICNDNPKAEGPYDVSKIIAANPQSPAFLPGKAHYWGEPELGYYLATDRSAIRKHAYLLADAGVDTLIFDTTNDVTYPESYEAVAEVFQQVRAEGEKTPDLCFLASEQSIVQVWDNLYSKGRFADLWFQWQGKPLLIFGQWEKRGLMPDVHLPKHITDFFTIRESWAWDSLPWYRNHGRHMWPWVANYPQCIGWDQPGVAEMVPAAVGQHPLSNIGRSFHDGHQPPANEYDVTEFTPQGLHFEEQWRRVLEVDPEFVFVTGWNEWTAGAAICDDPSQEALMSKWDFFPGAVLGRAGKLVKKGDLLFIDQYNQEFSRDAEPMRGGHSDNYYYQLVANIRRYKGVRKPQLPSGYKTIDIEAGFNQWAEVQPEFRDHQFETLPRNEVGWGGIQLRNETGRNEFVAMKIARDLEHLYFYVQTRENITPHSQINWMMLFINADQHKETGWEGYDYLINWPVLSGRETMVKRNAGGWNWDILGKAQYRYTGNQMMIAVPRPLLGLVTSPLAFDFHWADNLQHPGHIEDFFENGDSAPSRRFDYQFSEEPN